VSKAEGRYRASEPSGAAAFDCSRDVVSGPLPGFSFQSLKVALR
jgi:hypothetical protein